MSAEQRITELVQTGFMTAEEGQMLILLWGKKPRWWQFKKRQAWRAALKWFRLDP